MNGSDIAAVAVTLFAGIAAMEFLDLAGPSTIAVLLLLSSSEPERVWEWCAALVLAWSGTMLILAVSPWLMKVQGDRGVRAMERLMGMLLVLLAIPVNRQAPVVSCVRRRNPWW